MNKNIKKQISGLTLLMFLCTGCDKQVKIPQTYIECTDSLYLYPDYKNIIIPSNIAPLNFTIDNGAEKYIVSLKGQNGQELLTESDQNLIQFNPEKWRELLKQTIGTKIKVQIYGYNKKQWEKYKSYSLSVAEPIDSFLSYRLIEPGYELYRQLGLYQRNLATFDVSPIYENNKVYDDNNNHCVNCHNYQNYQTENMLFHVRAAHGGTIIADKEKIKKIIIKHDSILSSGVYPSWHPNHKWIAFSTNNTGQVFHIKHKEKVEVLDLSSDLLFYDAEQNEVFNILKTDNSFETFPCWSPDGKQLYYCVAEPENLANIPDSLKRDFITQNYNQLFYNIKVLDFNEKEKTFGIPKMVVDCTSQKKSASVPKISPNGDFLLYTLADYGQFHIWHKSADLWVKDLKNDSTYALTETNSKDVDSYHTWSSNGRWIVFSSRRDDGNYTRIYLAYFDRNGRGHKAFLLPQKDPKENILLLKSYNVPELTTDALKWTDSDFKTVIYNDQGINADYKGRIKTDSEEDK